MSYGFAFMDDGVFYVRCRMSLEVIVTADRIFVACQVCA